MISNKITHYERTIEFGKSYPETNYWNIAYDIEPLFEKLRIKSIAEIDAEWKAKMMHSVRTQEYKKDATPESVSYSVNIEEKSKQLWTMYKFYNANKRVFRLTNDLAIAMDNTKINDFMGYVNIPYDSIYLSFPQEYFKHRRMAKLDDMRFPWNIKEADNWLNRTKEKLTSPNIPHPKFIDLEMEGTTFVNNKNLYEDLNAKKRMLNGNRPEGVYLDIENNQLNMLVATKPHNYKDSVYYESTYRISIEINSGKSIKNIIDDVLEKFELDSSPSIPMRDGHDFVLNSMLSMDMEHNYTEFSDRQKAKKEEIKSIIILTLKTLAYINSASKDIKKIDAPSSKIINKKKFEHYPNRLKSRLPYYLVGGDIQINNKHNLGGEVTGTGRSLTTRFMVRGHYHHFWKKRTEEITDNMVVKTKENGQVLTRKWVAPYWKGPEYGDVVLRDYKVTK